MRCNRCGYAVPEWLWLAGDHPILVQVGTKIENLERVEGDENTFRYQMTETVQIKMCAEVNQPHMSQESERKPIDIPKWQCGECNYVYKPETWSIMCCPEHNKRVCKNCYKKLHPEK